MSTNVTYNATVYRVPAYQDTGYAQGSGNLSSYLIALATGSLTLAGGSFPLTADADFGASFGLKSIYYKSRATNPSTVGVVRLGSAEVVGWRNNANGADLSLTANSGDYLSFNGNGLTLTATSNQLKLGTTNVITISSTAPSVSRIYTLPDAGAAANIVLDQGAYTIAGAWTYSTAITITPTTNQLVLGTTRTVTISATQPASTSRSWTIPDITGNGTFAALEGTQTFSGAKTFSNAVAITATSNHLVLSTATNTLTINASTQATARVWSVPDISSAGTFAALEGAQTFSGAKTFSSILTVNSDITATGDIYTTALTDYSATSTITGWVSFTTKHIFYKRVGKTITIYFDISGTSNATSASFTVPVNANSSVDGAFNAITVSDSGSNPTTPGVALITNGTPGSVRCFKDWSTPSWTNTGTKTIEGQITYETV